MYKKLIFALFGLITPIVYAGYIPLPDEKVDTAQEVQAINSQFNELFKGKLDIRPRDVLPKTPDFYDLGSSSYSWHNLYIDNVYISSGGATTFAVRVTTASDLLIYDANPGTTTSVAHGTSIQHGTGYWMIGQGGRGLPDAPLTIWNDQPGHRRGINVVHKNSGLTRPPVAIFQNLDTPAMDVGNTMAFYGQTPGPAYADIQHGVIGFSQEATTNTAKFELMVRAGDSTLSDSIPVMTVTGSEFMGYGLTMFGPTGAAFAGLTNWGAYTPAAVVHVASDFQDQRDGVMIERRRTPNANRYVMRVDSNGSFLVENRDVANSGISISSTTGAVSFPQKTTAALAALKPSKAGECVFNTDQNEICRSTGTGTGAWVLIQSSATACD